MIQQAKKRTRIDSMSVVSSLKHEVAQGLLGALSMFLLALSFCSGDVAGVMSLFTFPPTSLPWFLSPGTDQLIRGQVYCAEIGSSVWRERERERERETERERDRERERKQAHTMSFLNMRPLYHSPRGDN